MTEQPKIHNVGIIMNGVTGRMGTNQHLVQSICAIRKEGGIKTADGEIIMPDPILVGRNSLKLRELCHTHGITRASTDLDACLDDPQSIIYFDAQTTGRRAEAVKKAIAKGKHVYCEKPTAVSSEQAYDLYKAAKAAGVKNGVVQDKLWLPGLVKLKTLIESGFFGDILSVRGEFGYWVFDGKGQVAPQRPSWNYRKEDDGGIISDMLCHWQYIIQNLFGEIQSVTCLGATHVKERVDEQGNTYRCTADDSAYATFQLHNGVIVHFNSSWAVRVRRDDLLTIQVDGTKGSAVAAPDVEPRCRLRHQVRRRLDTRPGLPGLRQCLQGAVGDVSAACGQGRAVEAYITGGREGRAACGTGYAELGEEGVGGRPSAGGMIGRISWIPDNPLLNLSVPSREVTQGNQKSKCNPAIENCSIVSVVIPL
ncbi:hypothetical protein K469DRAFT_718654 [Zopfia rhizophila CBS 207.26]|uniref:NAD(P)-binding protein n=1 Tax=Zopfia rhizophila CBS 207.26 TaxID=1314779 RepID=A0A6A6EL07_9PEZI|nr:hypothetical protein K469DRAFT_718654 [Zopfia rhizophila CBS 207.26]